MQTITFEGCDHIIMSPAAYEALEKDAARYRWLRGGAPMHSQRWARWDLKRWDGRCWHSLERGALDSAIDAAMGKD